MKYPGILPTPQLLLPGFTQYSLVHYSHPFVHFTVQFIINLASKTLSIMDFLYFRLFVGSLLVATSAQVVSQSPFCSQEFVKPDQLCETFQSSSCLPTGGHHNPRNTRASQFFGHLRSSSKSESPSQRRWSFLC